MVLRELLQHRSLIAGRYQSGEEKKRISQREKMRLNGDKELCVPEDGKATAQGGCSNIKGAVGCSGKSWLCATYGINLPYCCVLE